MPTAPQIADVYVPLATAAISLVAIVTALVTLSLSRRDRREAQRALAADASRREEEALLAGLHGDKEAVGFLALQLSREPHLVTDANRTRLCCALCLAFVFESSSRTRALVLSALQKIATAFDGRRAIDAILDEMRDDFRGYEVELGEIDLQQYIRRITKLRQALNRAPLEARVKELVSA
jgi:hypothetical protein